MLDSIFDSVGAGSLMNTMGLGTVATLGGALISADAQKDAARRNEALQREFAQHGIRWRVEDARAAGLHPLYALGGAGATFSPTIQTDPIGAAVTQMGQDVSRAALAGMTKGERQGVVNQQALFDMEMRERGLRMDLLELQIGKLRGQVPPAFPAVEVGKWGSDVVEGQADVTLQTPGVMGLPGEYGRFTFKPPEIESANPRDPSSVAGPPTPHWQTARMEDGWLIDLPSRSVTEQWEAAGESAALLALMMERNTRKYGRDWLMRFREIAPDRYVTGITEWIRNRAQSGLRDIEDRLREGWETIGPGGRERLNRELERFGIPPLPGR